MPLSVYIPATGTRPLFPPEYFDKKSYWARATTVWQLGALFYHVLTGKLFSINGFLNNSLKINPEWSTGRTHTHTHTQSSMMDGIFDQIYSVDTFLELSLTPLIS